MSELVLSLDQRHGSDHPFGERLNTRLVVIQVNRDGKSCTVSYA